MHLTNSLLWIDHYASYSVSNESIAPRTALSKRYGFGALALQSLLGTSAAMADSGSAGVNPLLPKLPHFAAKAKRVIHIFANGGPSHVDTFDPKPSILKYAGQPLPGETPRTERKTGALYPSPFKFKKYGESGLEVSELFENVARHADDLCVIRSMHADVPNHEPSLLLMNTGEARQVRPSMGSWLTYGLGTDNQNLPAFIAMCPGGYPIQESQNWQAGFLPGIFQGTYIDTKHESIDKLIEYIENERMTRGDQRSQLDLLQTLNRRHQQARDADPQLEARIQSFELAYRMQSEAAEVFDVSHEPQYVLDAYGPGVNARQLLIARRLIEHGVRYVQVWHGEGQPWDNHDDIEVNHRRLAKQCDQAIAALLSDLKERGLLEETLVIWGGEFAERPLSNCLRKAVTLERSTAAITTTGVSRCGLQAAVFAEATSMAQPMSLDSRPLKIESTFTIFMQRCSSCLDSITSSSPIAGPDATSV